MRELWTLIGVLLGFGLSQLEKWISERRRRSRDNKILREELVSIRAQIPHKTLIIDGMLNALQTGQVLDGRSVTFLRIGYEHVIPTLYLHLNHRERASLHVIYERLRLADERMASFATEVVDAVREKIIADPYGVYRTRLSEIKESCMLVSKLIDEYLVGKAVDVFAEQKKSAASDKRCTK